MLRRKHKKMRKKRGGAGFFDKFKDGLNTVNGFARQGISKTQQGISNAKMLGEQARQAHANEINKAREGGEYSDLAKNIMNKSVNKSIRKDPVGFMSRQQREIADTGVTTTFDRNPLFEPVKPKRKRQFTDSNSTIKRKLFGGGRRKRKTRRRRRKRKTRKKKRKKSRKTRRRRR
tara:strand:+ start:294 stop:818 length:525 start_codon:yes stop_codon:yes gene_type:complete